MVALNPVAARLRPTDFITFPRSGHHFLIDTIADTLRVDRPGTTYLGRYSSQCLPYCEFYTCPADLHCGAEARRPDRPCPQGFPFRKSHDFDLRHPPTGRTVVQIRRPEPALASWFALRLAEQGARPGPEHGDAWEEFCQTAGGFWVDFVERWVVTERPWRLLAPYEDLVTSSGLFRAVLRHVLVDPDAATETAGAAAHEAARRPVRSDPPPFHRPNVTAGLKAVEARYWPLIQDVAERDREHQRAAGS